MKKLGLVTLALGAAALLFACPKRPDSGSDTGASRSDGVPTSTTTAKSTVTATGARSIHRSYRAMGSQLTITAYTDEEAAARAAFDEVYLEFKRLENLHTVWREESDVSRINRAAGERPVVVSAETIDLLQRGRQFSEWTEGRFDLTFGALSGLWKFDHDQDNKVPSRTDIDARVKLIDYRRLRIDADKRTAFLEKPGMKLHLGGLGKGYAVDRAVEILRKRGLSDFMIQAGGDLYVAGHKGKRGWRVGVRDPRGPPTSYFAMVELTDATFSTSGDYERSFVKDGRRYHHIIDPTTGEPATACRSVTVMAPSAVLADGLSTGLLILGPEKGLPLIEKIEGVGAVIIDHANKVHVSQRLQGRVKVLRPPTPGI